MSSNALPRSEPTSLIQMAYAGLLRKERERDVSKSNNKKKNTPHRMGVERREDNTNPSGNGL